MAGCGGELLVFNSFLLVVAILEHELERERLGSGFSDSEAYVDDGAWG